MKILAQYALPVAAALLLIAFFTGLPYLKVCLLPGEEPLPERPGAGGAARRRECLALALLTLVYAAAAFTNLGNTSSPETFESMGGKSALIHLEGPSPSRILLYAGVSTGAYDIEYSEDGETFLPASAFQQDYVAVLKWHVLTPEPDLRARVVRLTCTEGNPYLGEIAFLDQSGDPIPVVSELPALCDEQGTVPASQNYKNSTYFDEIYHVRTAWEHLHNIWPYEISHPPLGKLILSLGITLLGMTPFGWRFMGTLFGGLMLPVMYLRLRRIFGGRAVPFLGTLLFATDFMHYTQTRIATIDTYAVFFILWMYLFMYVYVSREDKRALALSGLFFGLGAASKWTCIYAGAGLAVIWALHWAGRFLALRPAAAEEAEPILTTDTEPVPVSETDAAAGAASAPAVEPGPDVWELLHSFFGNCLFCVVFFVLLPLLIYLLAYIPYGKAMPAHSLGEYLRMVWDNQTFMFTYHAGVHAEHPYSSRWYQWVLNIRPILYYLEYFDDGTRSSICAFLNPAVCWGGLLSLFVLVYTALFRRDRKAAFILLGYLAQLLPWVFITRTTFEYHYFPSSVFLILAICYVFRLMQLNKPTWARYAVPFAVVNVLLFCLFFPALGGLPVDNALASRLMGWLPTWPL